MGTGKNSQCIEFQTPSGQTTAGCFEISCNKDSSKYKVIFERDENIEIKCSLDTVGNQIKVGMYIVKCMDPELICRNRNTKCPFDCFYRGKCRESGICTCNFFYEGDYCEIEKEFPSGLNSLWKQIKKFNGF